MFHYFSSTVFSAFQINRFVRWMLEQFMVIKKFGSMSDSSYCKYFINLCIVDGKESV